MQTTDASIRGRLEQRRAELEELARAIALPEPMPGTGEELGTPDQHPADQGTETFERSKDISILASIQGSLADVAFAFELLDAGEYGICQACGRPIGEARHEARPEARYCVDDQSLVERERDAASR